MEASSTGGGGRTRFGWTGGQFSLLRALVGLLVAMHFALALPHTTEPIFAGEGPALPSFAEFEAGAELEVAAPLGYLPLALGVLLGLVLAIGYRARITCIALLVLFLAEAAERPASFEAVLAPLALLVLICAAQRPAPFGSFDARGRLDPAGEWTDRRVPRVLLWVLFVVSAFAGSVDLLRRFEPVALSDPLTALGYSTSGELGIRSWFLHLPVVAQSSFAWLIGISGCLAALLALGSKNRFTAWGLYVALHLTSLAFFDKPLSTVAWLLILLAMFDPVWLAPKLSSRPLWIFYDGDCGLCHRMVRLVLAEDTSGRGFRFAPLQSPVFEARVPASERAQLPDSLALLDESGTLTTRATAVIQILEGLGGLWRIAALLLRLLPRPLADFGYACIASVRKRLFRKPEGACPMIPPALAGRFEFDASSA